MNYGNDVMAEIDKNGKIKSEYIYGIGRVCRVDYDGSGNITQKVYYHTDERGSVRLITDEAGNVIKEYKYDPFGSINYSQGIDKNRYRFCGKEYDDNTDLYYFGARYYDPLLGRFITEDPLRMFETIQQLNPYVYCYNNPVVYVDPDGRFPWVLFGIFVLGSGIFYGGFGESIAEHGLDISQWEWNWSWENFAKGMGISALAFLTAYYVVPWIAGTIAEYTGMPTMISLKEGTTGIHILGYLATPTAEGGVIGSLVIMGSTIEQWDEFFEMLTPDSTTEIEIPGKDIYQAIAEFNMIYYDVEKLDNIIAEYTYGNIETFNYLSLTPYFPINIEREDGDLPQIPWIIGTFLKELEYTHRALRISYWRLSIPISGRGWVHRFYFGKHTWRFPLGRMAKFAGYGITILDIGIMEYNLYKSNAPAEVKWSKRAAKILKVISYRISPKLGLLLEFLSPKEAY